MKTLKSLITWLLKKIGVFQLVFDYYHTVKGLDSCTRSANREIRRNANPSDPPFPPLLLVTSVTGTPSQKWFIESGTDAAKCIHQVLSKHGKNFADIKTVLDFGCGCGRVARHLPSFTAAKIHGVDVNHRAIRWCRNNLAFGQFEYGSADPPLPFGDSCFDLTYALSVFTHMPEKQQRSWIEELFRVINPGGFVIVTLHGPSYWSDLAKHQKLMFQQGQLVVNKDDAPGSNRCASYHPPEYAEKVLFKRFDLIEYQAMGALGNPHQDLYLLQKPGIGSERNHKTNRT